MDQRQQQVQVGAGLQESRLNTDFIEFLKKYGTYGLYALLAVVLAYVGWQRWTIQKGKALDVAFADLSAAQASNNPDTLLKTAADHKGQAAVWELATISAAEHYLDLARRGRSFPADPTKPDEAPVLTEEQIKENVQKAQTLLKDVLAKVGDDSKQLVIAQRVRWNLATAALNANDAASAKKYMDDYHAAAEKAGWTDMVAVANMRSAKFDRVLPPVKMLTAADLPQKIGPGEKVQVPGMGTFELKSGTSGRPLQNLTMDQLEELRKSGQLIPLDGQDPNQPIGTPVPAPTEPSAAPVEGAKNETDKPYEAPPAKDVP